MSMRFEDDRHPCATTKANRQLRRLTDVFDEAKWTTLRTLAAQIPRVPVVLRDQFEGPSSGFSVGVTRRLSISWIAPAPRQWMPGRPRRVSVLRDSPQNRALTSSPVLTSSPLRNGLRRMRLTTEARRRRQFATAADAAVPSTRREDTNKFRMRVETATRD